MSEKENIKRMVVEVDKTEYLELRSKLAREDKTLTQWTKEKIREELVDSSKLVPVAE